jgi:hypothetical protein
MKTPQNFIDLSHGRTLPNEKHGKIIPLETETYSEYPSSFGAGNCGFHNLSGSKNSRISQTTKGSLNG